MLKRVRRALLPFRVTNIRNSKSGHIVMDVKVRLWHPLVWVWYFKAQIGKER